MKLTKKQTVATKYLADKTTTEILFGGGAGGAKSSLGSLWLIDRCTRFPGTRWLMGRSRLKTLKETTLNTYFDIFKKLDLDPNIHDYNQQKSTIYYSNGSEILLKDLFHYPSDPHYDELGSLEITGAFLDEVNQIDEKGWNIVKSRIRYRLDEYGLTPKILGSCNPTKNWVYSRFYKPWKDGTLPEYRKFVQALLSDNPYISEHYRENLLTLDEISKQRLLFGEWEYDDDPRTLIDRDSIEDYFKNQHVEPGEDYITADIARKGRDSTIIRVWDGFTVIDRKEMKISLITESAAEIRKLANMYKVPMSQVIVDEDGIGSGVVDILECKGFVNNSRALDEQGQSVNYDSLKAQCTFKMAGRITRKEVYEECTDVGLRERIIQEMEQVKQRDIDKDGKLRVVPKEDVKANIGRSPDEWDSIMMREWFELQPSSVMMWG
ncbi:hypothetical protein LCGC14_0370890 [marine sediment metagenome]|uniref:Phage terminase large subunit N-terminal domain-containing protein n=1 Tax=marine sediment metagenome TaxID=412755 RepID=A0A0F9WDU8_9ZZZZ|nr:phage terminase large subunit [Maribacter sp.]HDZ04851.1 hypothetical protein [Maribacter sp.]